MSYSITTACTGCAACVKVCPVGAIRGERKKLHAIDYSICIDCGACGRICPFRAVLDDADQACRKIKRAQWLQPYILEEKCVSCGICLEVCPTGVLDLPEPVPPQVRAMARLKDAPNCIGCSFCAVGCPVEAIEMRGGNGT